MDLRTFIVELSLVIVQLCSVLAWPGVVLIVLIAFGKRLGKLFDRISGAKLPVIGGEFTFDMSESAPAIPLPDETDVRWDRVGNLYWLASDIQWTKYALYTGDSPKRILRGLRGAAHHAEQLLEDGPIVEQLTDLLAKARATDEWSQKDRREAGKTLTSVLFAVGRLAQNHQPDFVDSP